MYNKEDWKQEGSTPLSKEDRDKLDKKGVVVKLPPVEEKPKKKKK